MTNVINTAAWAGIYGAGLYGAGKVVGSTVSLVCNTGNWVWDSISARAFAPFPKQNAKEAFNGALWCGGALLAQRIASVFLSPVAPAAVVNAFSALGWSSVRSPLVEAAANKINTLFAHRMPFTLTLS